MPTDAPRTRGSALTHDEWRALRRIRMLQLVALCGALCSFAGFLVYFVAEVFDFKVMALTGSAYAWSETELVAWIGLGVSVLGGGALAIVISMLDRSSCPQCGRPFFGRPAASGLKSAHPTQRDSFQVRRLIGYWSQRCANCDLSLGLAVLPVEPT
ncbi:hypothetical protein [Candidatus Binatus sp.]|uniref:hypothetical protein n=1 Tax=Candidatus Binatus sp. TaxID=2811406 RepID=UPI003C34C3E1